MRGLFLVTMLSACGLTSRIDRPVGDGGGEQLVDAGEPADAGEPGDAGTPVVPVDVVTPVWKLRGATDEYSMGAAASGSHIVWARYVLGSSGVIATIDRASGALLASQATDLAPYNVVSHADEVGLIARGVASVSDWRVLWASSMKRSDAMNVVTVGGTVAGAMFSTSNGQVVHVIGPRDSAGTHVSAIVDRDGTVTRTETPCGPASWWDSDTAGDTMNRFFIGSLQGQPCNLGDGNYVEAPTGGWQFVLVRYQGDGVPGVPTVRTLPLATTTMHGPAALGANADAVWVAYYSASSHLRLQRFSVGSVEPVVDAEATGEAFVPGTAQLGLTIGDVIPHPTRDRVYVLASVADSRATFAGEVLPAVDQPTLAVFTFDRNAKLLHVSWIASSDAPKSASSMALIDDKLVVSGQCESAPRGTTEALCLTITEVTSPTSFLFAIDAD